jgi:hypothetical protein
VPFACAEPTVVTGGRDAFRFQQPRHLVTVLDRGDIDDPRALGAAHRRDQPLLLCRFPCGVVDGVAEVLAEDPQVHDLRRFQLELTDHVADDRVGRRRRQRQNGRRSERFLRRAEPEERRTKVVAPLREAVRFVDDEQIHGRLFERVDERPILEPLGSREHEIDPPVTNRGEGILDVLFGNRRVDRPRRDAELVQFVGLVLHQRDERRDDDRCPRKVERRKLVAERLSRTRRHDRDRIAAADNGLDDLFLSGPER